MIMRRKPKQVISPELNRKPGQIHCASNYNYRNSVYGGTEKNKVSAEMKFGHAKY